MLADANRSSPFVPHVKHLYKGIIIKIGEISNSSSASRGSLALMTGLGQPIEFSTIEMRERVPVGTRSHVYLERNRWDDYGFKTLWNVHVVDAQGGRHQPGGVRIGSFHIGERGRTDVPESFDQLPETFFSLGSDESYYAELTALGDDVRDAVLRGLRDCALDLDLFDQALPEPVMTTSLLRSTTASTVRGQLHRMATGGVRLSPYEFSFRSPFVDRQGRTRSEVTLDFKVEPESRPASNVHVLIGRNGIGKSVLLNNMTNALVRPGTDNVGEVEFVEPKDSRLASRFAGVVSVAFSAFDEFEPLHRGEDEPEEFSYHYIGLKLVDPARSGSLKSSVALAREFGASVRACIDGPRLARWRRALEMLEGDPLFAQLSVANLAKAGRSDRELTDAARALFRGLSSGHKIVLLTMTRLVETVEEATLVLLDEPEAHLHPPLLAAFVRALSDLLENRNGVAIIATHSPVILQEVPKSCVWKLRRTRWQISADRPEIQTFGENVGILTQEVFGLEVTASGFHRTLAEAANSGLPYDELVEQFDGQLGGEARALLRALVLTLENL